MTEKTRICSMCHTRPSRVTRGKRGREKQQGTCARCHAAYMRRLRAAERVLRGTFPRGTLARIAKANRRLEGSAAP